MNVKILLVVFGLMVVDIDVVVMIYFYFDYVCGLMEYEGE